MKKSVPDRCWSCLVELDADNAVDLSAELHVPCCRGCWAELPVSQRLALGRELTRLPHELAAAVATKEGWMQVRELFRAAQAGELQRISPFDVGDSLN
ncbi:MAG: hypothetical protein NT013_00440 [Planctomycetia bacterium]|nr:hypothetical protein [Planctomycetia bacterium]